MGIFENYAQHDPIADAWLSKLIRLAGRREGVVANPTTAAEELALAEWVFTMHHGGEPASELDRGYIAAVRPIWERIFCVAGTGTTSYLRVDPLQVTP